jgi:hypothetical protein
VRAILGWPQVIVDALKFACGMHSINSRFLPLIPSFPCHDSE